MREQTNGTSKKATVLITILTAAAVLGSTTFGIRLPVFMLSPVRIMLLITVVASFFMGAKLVFAHEVSSIYKFWGCLFLYACLSGFWVVDNQKWMTGLSYLLTGILIFFVFLCFDEILSFFKVFQVVIALFLILIIIWGWYEVTTGNYMFVQKKEVIYLLSFEKNRVPIFVFLNTNNYALFVSFALILLFSMMTGHSIIKKLIYIGLIVSSSPLLIISNSRANVIGLAIGIAVWIFAGMTSKLTMRKVVIAVLLALAVLIFVIVFWSSINNALSEFFYFSGKKADSSKSNISRSNATKNGIEMVFNSFGLGVGCGNSSAPVYSVYNTMGNYDQHNWWLLVFCEYGIIFGVAYIIIYILQIRKLLRFLRNETDSEYRKVFSAFAAIDTAFIVCLVSPSGIVAMEWLWVYWGFRYAWVNKYCLTQLENTE